MDEVFLEIMPANFTVADFEKHQLPIPNDRTESCDFKLTFFTEDDYYKYFADLEKESNTFLSQYWMMKSQDLIDKNIFINKVLTVLAVEKLKKHKYPE